MSEHGVKIEGETVTHLEAPASLQDLHRMKASLEMIRTVTDSLVTLGILDAPYAAPLPDAGVLTRYEAELEESRTAHETARVAANEMSRVFLTDREIQSAPDDPYVWGIAVTRARQERERLGEGLQSGDVRRDLKLREDQLLVLAAAIMGPDCKFTDEGALILAAVTAAKRENSPWDALRKMTDARDIAVQVADERHATIEELKGSRDRWKERAEAAERGQPGRYSNPSPPADGGAVVAAGGWCCPADQVPPELLECTGGSECPAAVHAAGCYSETWTRAASKGEDDKE